MKKEKLQDSESVKVVELNDKSKRLIEKLFIISDTAKKRLDVALESMALTLDLPKGATFNPDTFNFEIREK